jgi:hypothetical protein
VSSVLFMPLEPLVMLGAIQCSNVVREPLDGTSESIMIRTERPVDDGCVYEMFGGERTSAEKHISIKMQKSE